MRWHQVPYFNTSPSSLDDNPFAGSRAQPTGKVTSIKLPADEWLCRKLEKLNVTMAKGYLSKNSETAGLLRDQFVKTPRSSKQYNMYTEKKTFQGLKCSSHQILPCSCNEERIQPVPHRRNRSISPLCLFCKAIS